LNLNFEFIDKILQILRKGKQIIIMKNKQLTTVLLLFILTGGVLFPQGNNGELNLSLKEAQEYAVGNNKMVRSARLDVESSRLAIWEVVSAALPQINATGSFTDNLKLRTMLLPAAIFGDTTGRKIPVRFGSTFNTSYGIQANMLIFNAPLYLGMESVKLANKLAGMNLQKTEIETKEGVATAYYLTLVSEESLRIIDGNMAILNELFKSTKAMFSAGMAESTDVDQMMSNVTMMQNTRSSMERNIELNYNLLRFELGVKPDTKITLTENLKKITESINIEALFAQEFNYNNNINYQLMEGQEKISELALKSKKASILPTLAGFYSYSKDGQGDKIAQQMWYPSAMAGIQISVPIFSGGERYIGIKKAQINLQKARNTKELITDQLLLQEKQLRYNLVSANMQYKSQMENIEVAKRVYTSTENKFKQGMASSLDLTQANSLYLQAENNYVSSLMNLLQTKLALDKLLNNM
jgi:outer membrane protein